MGRYHKMFYPILVLVIIILDITSFTNAAYYEKIQGFNLADNVLLKEESARSATECATVCGLTKFCLSFAFGELTRRCDLSSMKMAGSQNLIPNADVSYYLQRANVTEAAVTGPAVTGADVTGPDVTGPDVTEAGVTEAAFTEAVVTEAVVTEAAVSGPDVTGAAVTGPAVGGAPINLSEPAGTKMNIFLDYQFPTHGQVSTIMYFNPVVNVDFFYFDVFRNVTSDQLELVGSNIIDVSSTGLNTVIIPEADRIVVQPGDCIGVHFPSGGGGSGGTLSYVFSYGLCCGIVFEDLSRNVRLNSKGLKSPGFTVDINNTTLINSRVMLSLVAYLG